MEEEVQNDLNHHDAEQCAQKGCDFRGNKAEELRENPVHGIDLDKRKVCLVSEYPEVHGIEHCHRENACQKSRDVKMVVNCGGYKSAEHA